ncbi:MAG: DUF1073 domain-containing protein [Thermoplasmatales archaeon]|nr:DUF1073 domain-containing protein [Thermoplasmatales archaeon]
MKLNIFRKKEAGFLKKRKEFKKTISTATNYFSTIQKEGISDRDKELAFRRDPLIFKGITKKAEDIFREGWDIIKAVEETDADKEIRKKIYDFNQRTNLKEKLKLLAINTLIYGDGFLELDDGGDNPEMELEEGGLKNIHIIYPPAMKLRINKSGDVEAYEYDYNGIHINFHPTRIIHCKFYTYGEGHYGVSVIEVAYNNLLAKMNADVAVGEILYMTGKPFPILKKNTTATEQEMEDAENIIKNLNPRSGIVLDGDWNFDLKSPSVINTYPFNENFYINLAAALRMPHMILLGVQKGTVTGSEVDLADYYKDIKNLQEIIFTPILKRIYKAYLSNFDFNIWWLPLFTNEREEAEIFEIKCRCARILWEIGYPSDLIYETIENLYFDTARLKEVEEGIEAVEKKLHEKLHIEKATEKDKNIVDKLRLKEWERERKIAEELGY